MDHITRAELRSLVTPPPTAQSRVSIYVPLHRAYPEAQENPALLREALDQAERELEEHGLTEHDARRFLQLARDLERQRELAMAGWAEGLAVLVAPDSLRHWRLPYRCPVFVEVGRAFYLAPLMRMLTWPAEFFLLALSANSVHLYRGTREELIPVELPSDVKSQIEAAFRRSAEIDARRIGIEARDSKVILHGRVHSWAERDEAQRAAWAAPGVTAVENHLTVTP